MSTPKLVLIWAMWLRNVLKYAVAELGTQVIPRLEELEKQEETK